MTRYHIDCKVNRSTEGVRCWDCAGSNNTIRISQIKLVDRHMILTLVSLKTKHNQRLRNKYMTCCGCSPVLTAFVFAATTPRLNEPAMLGIWSSLFWLCEPGIQQRWSHRPLLSTKCKGNTTPDSLALFRTANHFCAPKFVTSLWHFPLEASSEIRSFIHHCSCDWWTFWLTSWYFWC